MLTSGFPSVLLHVSLRMTCPHVHRTAQENKAGTLRRGSHQLFMRELLCSKNCSGAENTPQNEMQDVRGGLLKLRIPLWVVWPAGAHLPWAPLQDEGSSLPVYRSL